MIIHNPFFSKLKKFLKLFNSAFASYRGKIGLMAVLGLISGFLEGIGVNTLIPVFSLVDARSAGPTDVVSTAIKGFFSYFNFSYSISFLLLFIIIIFLIKAVILFINHYITLRIMADYEIKARSKLFQLALESDWPYLSRQKIGYLDQILVNDVSRSAGILYHVGISILIFSNLIVYSLLVVNISWVVALLALLLGGAMLLIFRPFYDRYRILSGGINANAKAIAHFINQNIIGMKIIKSLSAENRMLEKAKEYFNHLKKLRINSELVRNFTNILLQPISVIFIVGFFVYFYKFQEFNFASFAIIVYALNRIFSNVQGVQSEIQDLSSRIPHLISVLDFKEETIRHRETDSEANNFVFTERLEFKNVHFAHEADRELLKNISFFVKKGEMIGVIGHSGAGKTTLVDLLLRLLKPAGGRILVDGRDIGEISLKEWRCNIGYVSQDVFLMSDTIRNNIKFYDDAVSDADIIAAAKIANIYDFIQKQPKKFDTSVGERGLRLSGGERQRIALARALARKPEIIILDEATNALDNESETLIQKAIDGLKGKITIIAIAHRLSTIINADCLIVMEGGKITETGAPKELLEDHSSYFYKVYNLRK